MAATGVTRWAWPAAAALAAAFIAVLALYGERPEPGLVRFVAGGPMADWPVARIGTLEVGAGATRRLFRRTADGGWRTEAGVAPSAALVAQIEAGLALLRNSAPQRTLDAGDLAGQPLAEFGLAPPRLKVSARTAGGPAITIEFGNPNPLGLARYARVSGRPEILLLSSFVAETWERVAAMP